MAFHVGQKVVFVGGPKLPGQWGPRQTLKKGEVYTIRKIDPVYLSYYGTVGLHLHEIAYEPMTWRGEPFVPSSLAIYFRPVIERKTDISIFTAMLTPNRVNA